MNSALLAPLIDRQLIADGVWLDEVGSTNDYAQTIAASPSANFPYLIGAELQTGGRGRGANRWWSGAGSLTFSLVLDAQGEDLAPALWPYHSLLTGLAIAETLAEFVPHHVAEVKWPNDVYLAGKKICGVLIEAPSGAAQGKLIVGIGINVNNSLAQAPAEVAARAVALCDLVGCEFDRFELLAHILSGLRVWRRLLVADGFGPVRAAYSTRCFLTSKQVRVESGGEVFSGLCQGINSTGALVLQTGKGAVALHAGGVLAVE
jgi:BirA family biotin operon repressor/biotin-[acetyl-CoA-carboxylase] ligase